MADKNFSSVLLTENDIPGAKLCYNDVCEHTVSQLKSEICICHVIFPSKFKKHFVKITSEVEPIVIFTKEFFNPL